MGIWDKLKGELIDIVEWLDSSSDTMVYRFERLNNEIKYGAKLVVREGQVAVFENMGQIADVFKPGMYTLDTKNLPILSTLMGWKYGFESPFKAEVYFVNTRDFRELKWGTMNPIMLRDAEFGPVRLRAFGSYAIHVKDAAAFIRKVVGTDNRFTTDEITGQLRDMIVARFGNILGESKIPALDLAANYNQLGEFMKKKLQPEFDPWGLELALFYVENISLPPEVEAAMDKRTSMGVIGNMDQYTRYQVANSIPDGMKNPGGLAGPMMGVGVGLAAGQQVGGALAGAMGAGGGGAAPPPIPGAGAASFFVAVNGQQTGPFDMQTLGVQAQSGRLTRQTLVWRPGMPGWVPAEQVGELSMLLASTPPPVPPTA